MSSRPRRKSSRRPKPMPPVEVTIDRIGARGDGIAAGPDGPLYIPGAAIGDKVLAVPGAKKGDGRAATLKTLLEAGPGRVEPACRHADRCGGCGLQHLSDAVVADLKRQQLAQAFARKGLSTDLIGSTKSVPPGTRRRLRLSALRPAKGPVLGFNERASSLVLDIAECPVARPELVALLDPIRTLVGCLDGLGKGGDVQLTLTDTGVDLVLLPHGHGMLSLDERERLVQFAETHDIARLAWESDGFVEPVATRRTPRAVFAETPVDLPAGSFLQPSREGQTILTECVLGALPPDVETVADLYAGCGSFSIPLAKRGLNVVAVEGEQPPVDALRRAAAGLRLRVDSRDLAKNPLSTVELNRFDAVIFDPPRAGAASQAAQLAASEVPLVIAVSCNPATLARDLHSLLEGGYSLQSATPVDQFTWSAHLEAVAVLTKK